MKKCDIRFKVENDLTTIGAVDESNNIQDITAVTEYKNQFDKEARFFYNYKKEVFAFDGYQLKFNESNLKEFNKIQKNENNYYRTRLGDNLVTVRKNLEVFVEQGLNSVENFNFKDKENKLFDKGIPFENISIEQRQALSKQNIIYPANIINKTDLPIEIKNYVNLYNQYISLNSSNRANFATNRSVINENTVLYLDSANKLNYIMAASDLASLEESEVHGNNYLSIALAQRGEQEDVNISESVSDNPVHIAEIGNTIYPGFDKELAQKIQDILQKLYPEIKLNITNNPAWKQGDNVFNQEEYNNQVNYRLKATEILLSDKAKQVFAKGEKAKWDLNKILTELAIPKEQKQLLLDLGIKDRKQLISNIKPKDGVSELFESNPELANEVYKALGLNVINESEITYTDEEGNPCAKMGLTNATKGTGWKIVKDFKGQPKHSQGGVDITISDKGVTMRRGGKDIKAKYGLLIINNN